MQFNVKKKLFLQLKEKNLEFSLLETRKKKKCAFVQGE